MEAVRDCRVLVLGAAVPIGENLVKPLASGSRDRSINRVHDQPRQQIATGLRTPPHDRGPIPSPLDRAVLA